ncbi:hypothetical protein [Parageobacillus toebii]|uniref:hypothetical protein n=1 Tax=Parageobacillus toebii TaxID=153151 RepID=UPI002E2362A5|nr:hypothetical protein [Parageobacillus toebii]
MNLRKQKTKPWFSPEYSRLSHSFSAYSTPRKDNSNETVRGDEWDRIGLQELLNVKHRSLFNEKSAFQNIQIIEATDLRMYLDEQLQFSSLDERIYHEALVHPAFTFASNHERVLILGGGTAWR